MVWDKDRFDELERKVRDTLEGRRLLKEVPYYIYLYDPKDEPIAIDEFQNLERRLNRPHSAECVWLSDFMIDFLQKKKFINSMGIRIENERREEVLTDLKNLLPEFIQEKIAEILRGKERSHCAILLRYGALRPFVQISSLIPKLVGVVKCTLVIPYPGHKIGWPLDQHPDSLAKSYRAEVI